MFFLMPHQQGRKELFSSILPFMLGLLVSLLPSLSLFVLAPKQFLFGNFTYAAYNTLFRQQQGFGVGEVSETTMTFFGKLSFLTRYVLIHPNTGFLIIATSFFLIQFYRDRKRKSQFNLEVIFSLTLLVFLLIGSLAPTPTWYQYFYAPLPFLMITLLYVMAVFTEQDGRARWITILVVLVLVISISFGVKFYQNLGLTLSPVESLAVRIHTAGRELVSRVGTGRVLTLAPIYPLEGGASIYEEFATGSFGWRVAPLIPIEERLEVGLVADSDLQKMLQLKPPAAILTGYEASLEQAFAQVAKELNFRPVKLTADKKLWLAPP
jgi:hypothetical protein